MIVFLEKVFRCFCAGDGAGFDRFKREGALGVAEFEELIDAVRVPLSVGGIAVEGRVHEDVHEALDHLPARQALGEREDVRIVMTAGEFGRVGFEHDGAANPGDLVCGNRDADARSANDDAAIGLPARDRFADGETVLRIVDRNVAVRSEIENLVAVRAKHRCDLVLVAETGMIRAERNFHERRALPFIGQTSEADMKLACSSRSFASALDRGDLTQLEVLDLSSRELGVDGVVLDVRHFPRTDDDYLAQIKKMATDLGLSIAAIESDDFFTSGPAASRAVLDVAARVGAPLVTATLAAETALPWSTQLEYLSEAAGAAKAANVTLALRNAPGTYAWSAHDCKRATKETDSAWLRFGLEPAAFDAASDVAALADRTVLLWSSLDTQPDVLLTQWPDYRGFLALTHPSGCAMPEDVKNAIRRWRIALAHFELNRT